MRGPASSIATESEGSRRFAREAAVIPAAFPPTTRIRSDMGSVDDFWRIHRLDDDEGKKRSVVEDHLPTQAFIRRPLKEVRSDRETRGMSGQRNTLDAAHPS